MEMRVEIKHLEELLQPIFKQKIISLDYCTKRLTAAGENYGSQMLEVEVKIKNGAVEEETLNMVAKMPPPNEWLKEVFHTIISFKKEIAIYKIIFPTLREFQIEQGNCSVVNFFPNCYGARISDNPFSTVVDDDAILLLENLHLSGFQTVDRMKGFDFEAAKLLMNDMAVFHAVPIAIKLIKPDVFKEKILPHLNPVQVFDSISEEMQISIFDLIIKTAKVSAECLPLVPKIVKALQFCLNNMKNYQPPREPFGTISHNDYWVNNTMIKFVDNRATKNKMIDFQLTDYGSPGKDIVFFLFSSVQKQVIDLHYDSLVQLYYDKFIDTLKNLNCDSSLFSFELLQEEIAHSAKTTEFFHVLDMLLPIYAVKGKVKELSEMTEKDIITEDQISDLYKKKVPEIILEFVKRCWI